MQFINRFNERSYRPKVGTLMTISTSVGNLLAGLVQKDTILGMGNLIHIYDGWIDSDDDDSIDDAVRANRLLMAPMHMYHEEFGKGGCLRPIAKRANRPQAQKLPLYYTWRQSSKYLKDANGFCLILPSRVPFGYPTLFPKEKAVIRRSTMDPDNPSEQISYSDLPKGAWLTSDVVMGQSFLEEAIYEALYGGNAERFRRAESAQSEYLKKTGGVTKS